MAAGIGRERLRRLARLRERKVRLAEGLQLLEGRRLVEEAASAGRLSEIFVRAPSDARAWSARCPSVPVHVVGAEGVERLADVRTPQEVVAVGPLPEPEDPEDVLAGCERVLLLDGVQDPGNAGALVRTAAGLGLGGVLAGPGTADLSSPKVLRATAGAVFRVRLGRVPDPAGLEAVLRETGHALVVPVPRGGRDVTRVAAPPRFVLVAGNEGAGAAAWTRSRAALLVTIPLARGVESLNVAAACAVILGRWLA